MTSLKLVADMPQQQAANFNTNSKPHFYCICTNSATGNKHTRNEVSC